MSTYNLAHQLARELGRSEEREAYDQARKNIEKDEGAVFMLKDFRQKQIEFEVKSMQGEELSEAEIERMRKLVEAVSMHRPLAEFLGAEMRLLQLANDVQKIIADSLGLWDYLSDAEAKEADISE